MLTHSERGKGGRGEGSEERRGKGEYWNECFFMGLSLRCVMKPSRIGIRNDLNIENNEVRLSH